MLVSTIALLAFCFDSFDVATAELTIEPLWNTDSCGTLEERNTSGTFTFQGNSFDDHVCALRVRANVGNSHVLEIQISQTDTPFVLSVKRLDPVLYCTK